MALVHNDTTLLGNYRGVQVAASRKHEGAMGCNRPLPCMPAGARGRDGCAGCGAPLPLRAAAAAEVAGAGGAAARAVAQGPRPAQLLGDALVPVLIQGVLQGRAIEGGEGGGGGKFAYQPLFRAALWVMPACKALYMSAAQQAQHG